MVRLFKHYVPHSFLMLGAIEIVILMSSIYLGASLRFAGEDQPLRAAGPLLPKALIFTLVMISVMTAVGLYKSNLRDGIAGMLLRIGISILLGLAAMSFVFYLFPVLFLGRGAFGLAFAAALTGIVLARIIFFKVVNQDAMKRRILVLGTGKRAVELAHQMRRKVDKRGFVIVGYVHVTGEHDVIEPHHIARLDVPLLEYADQQHVDEIVVAVEDRRKGFPVHQLLDCKMSGIEVVDMLTFFERQGGKIRLDLLHPSWLIFSDGFLSGFFQAYTKRMFDIVASLALLTLTWPIMIVAALAIKLESPGPVLYRQIRVGQNWRLVQVLKFRSMCNDAEKDGPQWAGKNDSRVTRIGAFIRKVRIDELPQLYNVLKGEMSFVGPRPERPMFVEQLSQTIPYYAERHRVKPGITGWAQIRYPYGSTEKDAVEKLQYDLYYVKNYSLFLDLLILFQTAEVILWGRGAR